MPIYDYECKDCGKEFNVVTSITEHEKQQKQKKVRCPKCHSKDVRPVYESVFVTTSKKS